MPRRRFPAAGAPLLAFLGFFEKEFRTFDFSLGMYDALRMFEEAGNALPRAAHVPGEEADPALALRLHESGLRWDPSAEEACRPEELSDFRALLQVSLDQLYDTCSQQTEEGARKWRNPHCQRASRGEAPPRVPGIVPRKDTPWRQRVGEEELAYTLRLLGAYGFRFHDLGCLRDGATWRCSGSAEPWGGPERRSPRPSPFPIAPRWASS